MKLKDVLDAFEAGKGIRCGGAIKYLYKDYKVESMLDIMCATFSLRDVTESFLADDWEIEPDKKEELKMKVVYAFMKMEARSPGDYSTSYTDELFNFINTLEIK